MTSATQPAAKQPNVTQQLAALFDQVGPDVLCLSFAQALADAHGLNRTSAGITFYRWRAARAAGLGTVPTSSASAKKAPVELPTA